jgi:uncharacterized protein
VLNLFVDADGCAVKDEVYRVAERLQLRVILVANKRLLHPPDPRIEMITVPGGLDVADDWIAENIGLGDIAITSDIPLAARCLQKGARVLGPKGHEFTEDSIGDSLATRELMSHLRGIGQMTGGPSAMTKKDRSNFLSSLDRVIQQIRQKHSQKPKIR